MPWGTPERCPWTVVGAAGTMQAVRHSRPEIRP
jgi:hypothetical protein